VAPAPASDEVTRFELDRRAEGSTAALRLTGAVVVGAGATAIAAGGPGVLGWIVAGVGGLAAVGWVFAWRRGRARARRPEAWFLSLGRRELVLAEGPKRLQIPWDEVKAVEVDEDRLVVRLRCRAGAPVDIQPRYRGVGLHGLADALREARRDAG